MGKIENWQNYDDLSILIFYYTQKSQYKTYKKTFVYKMLRDKFLTIFIYTCNFDKSKGKWK